MTKISLGFMGMEQAIGRLQERIHNSAAVAAERLLEKPRILLDRLAHNLDWIKHTPILLATIYGKIKL